MIWAPVQGKTNVESEKGQCSGDPFIADQTGIPSCNGSILFGSLMDSVWSQVMDNIHTDPQ